MILLTPNNRSLTVAARRSGFTLHRAASVEYAPDHAVKTLVVRLAFEWALDGIQAAS